jgi:hypothetical protein
MTYLLSIRHMGPAYAPCSVSYCALPSGAVHSRRAQVRMVTAGTNPANGHVLPLIRAFEMLPNESTSQSPRLIDPSIASAVEARVKQSRKIRLKFSCVGALSTRPNGGSDALCIPLDRRRWPGQRRRR